MSESPLSEEEATWRRRFASRANNRAWTLSEQKSRTPQEDREMLDAAHASMHLWSTIGTARNVASAQLLLGQVHALLANAQYALPYAQAAHVYFTSNPSEPGQVAFSHAVMAAAAHSAGNSALHETHYLAAIALIGKLPNKEEKANLEATLNVIPKPGTPRS
ncbi:MAG TPA: hypothetical protein VGI90_04860 [Steroidobacteraceae bacterium]